VLVRLLAALDGKRFLLAAPIAREDTKEPFSLELDGVAEKVAAVHKRAAIPDGRLLGNYLA
jgi:hypothetical protein